MLVADRNHGWVVPLRLECISISRCAPVGSDQRSIFKSGFKLRGLTIEVQHQRAILEGSAVRWIDPLVAIEEVAMNLWPIAADLDSEWNANIVDSNGCVPGPIDRLAPRRKGDSEDCYEASG